VKDVYLETGKNLDIIEKLGFSRCRLSLAIPKSEKYSDIGWFQGKRIATSFPRVLQEFLDREKIKAEMHVISGSVEIAPGIGLADCICDLVSSGSTLISNGLKEVEVILQSEAIIIANRNLANAKSKILNELVFRIRSVLAARDNKYILLNAPNDTIPEICGILPGMKSPTVLPLADEGWSSVHSVVNEKKFWEIIDQLKEAGAQGILVVPIEKMIL